MDPWFLLKLIPVKNFLLSSDFHHHLSAWERNDGEMERRRIDGELTEMEAVARDRLSKMKRNKTDFGGEKPTKERDTLRKSVNKYEEEEEHGGMVERSLSESWPELRNGGGGGARMERSNSNVSWRSSGGVPARKVNGLERNKSSRYGENGMLDFYLAPMNGSRRLSVGSGGGGGWANSHGHSIARNVMRLY
ncbi:hypothetical protein YC2023_006328 [Brassica napus]